MRKIRVTTNGACLLTTKCPNGFDCKVGSGVCMRCRHNDKKASDPYRFVVCKLDNKQLNLFDQ